MPALDVTLIGELYRIWEEKQWEFPTKENEYAAFEKLCEMFSRLSAPLQNMALKLTRAYSYYSHNNYLSLLLSAFGKIDDTHLAGINQIIFAPLLNPGDDKRRKSKSGHGLPYNAEHLAVPNTPKLQGLKITALAGVERVPEIIGSDKQSLLILLDDFVGSGDTAKLAVQDLQRKVNSQVTIIVIALVAMRHAVKRLAECNIEVICGEMVLKGIEENDLIDDKPYAYSLIDGIEASLDITEDQRRGYMNSEALITMIRTPDNTFPIYWCTKQLDGSDWPAPFPREF